MQEQVNNQNYQVNVLACRHTSDCSLPQFLQMKYEKAASELTYDNLVTDQWQFTV